MQRKHPEHSATGTASTPREVAHTQRDANLIILMGGRRGLHGQEQRPGAGCAHQRGQMVRAQAYRKEGACFGMRTLIWVQHGMWAYLGRRDKSGTGSCTKDLDYEDKELSMI